MTRKGLLTVAGAIVAIAMLSVAGCGDESGEDCELGTECPGGGCLDGVCVTICDDPCGGRDDLTCVINAKESQLCVTTELVDIDNNFAPVASSQMTNNNTDDADVSETDSAEDTDTSSTESDTDSSNSAD